MQARLEAAQSSGDDDNEAVQLKAADVQAKMPA